MERLEVSYPPTQIEFEVPWRPKTQLAGLRQQLGGLGPTERGTERRLGRRELVFIEHEGLIQDLLRRRQRLRVEGQDAPHEAGDDVIQFGVRDGAVDPPVALSRIGIEIISAEDDLYRPRATDQERESLERAAAWDQAEADLRLSKDCPLSACESDIAGKCKFVPSGTRPTTDDRD
jgi:hypothetical protein